MKKTVLLLAAVIFISMNIAFAQNCTDSDSSLGFSAYLGTRGVCTDSTGTYTDSSSSNVLVNEYSCGPTSFPLEQQTCYLLNYNCLAYGYSGSLNGSCTMANVSSTCHDSDESLGIPGSFAVKGTCTDAGGSYTDYSFVAEGKPALMEYSCSVGNCVGSNNFCSFFGYTGSSEGVCTNSTSGGGITNQTCTDSDNGRYYDRKGNVSVCTYGASSGGCSLIADSCSGNLLTERYCSGNEAAYESYNCPYGCSDGRCLSTDDYCGNNACDSETRILKGGESLYVTVMKSAYNVTFVGASSATQGVVKVGTDSKSLNKGTVSSVGGLIVYLKDLSFMSSTDQEKNTVTLVLGENEIHCSKDCKSVNQTQICTDSDGGKNYYQYGSAKECTSSISGNSGGGGCIEKKDFCSGDQLYEYYCTSDNIATAETYRCESGCSNGACIIQNNVPNSIIINGKWEYVNDSVKVKEFGYGGHPLLIFTDDGSPTDFEFTVKIIGNGEVGICGRMDNNGKGYCLSRGWGGADNIVISEYTGYPYNPGFIKGGPSVNTGNVTYLKLKMQGATVSGRAWGEGEQEPANDMVAATSSAFDKTGHVGFYTYYSAAQFRTQSLALLTRNQTQTCTDTDGGKDYYTRGSVSACSSSSGTGGGSGTCTFGTDSCNENKLLEGYCDGNKVATENYNCPNGCSDGACIKPECQSDSDCPQITCIQAPCPVNRCEDGKCVLSSCGNGICESGEADDCPICVKAPCPLGACRMGTCQKDCETRQLISAYMQTNKYKYKPYDAVEITATAYGNRNDGSDLENIDLTAIVKSPGARLDKIKMNKNSIACPVSEQTSTNEEIISSETQVSSSGETVSSKTIMPSGCIATYTAAYQGAKTTGFYGVGGESSQPNVIVSGTSFEVFDPALLEKYLILDDIGGYKYIDAQSSESSADYTLYTATYEKDGEGFAAGVAQFNSEESLKKALNEILRNYNDKIRKEVINGNMVYVIEDSYQQVTFWTSKNFIVFVMKSSVTSQSGQQTVTQTVAKKSVTTTQTLSVAKPTSSIKALAKPTGMAVKTTPSSLGTATTSSTGGGGGIACQVIPEPVCLAGTLPKPIYDDNGCISSYNCVPAKELPIPLLKAYLDKYPSDLSAIGTQCESKKGYCISSDSDCRRGYAESSLSCNSNSEKCCVKEVSMGDIMEIVVKLDSLKNVFKQMQQESGAMADYYDSIGDSANAKKYNEVSDMFGTAADKTSAILQKIKDNLDNPDAIMDEVKKDIQELKDYIKEIIRKIIGG